MPTLALLAAGAALLLLLSGDPLAMLLAWVVASLPIGILAGHCVLNDPAAHGSRLQPPS